MAMASATHFDEQNRQTVMVLSTLRAVAASCMPATRLLGNIRCDDIIRSVDERMPLDEFWPGETQDINPAHIYMRRDWRDGAPSDEVLMGVFTCALYHHRDASLAGPLRAGEMQDALYHVLPGRDFAADRALDEGPQPG